MYRCVHFANAFLVHISRLLTYISFVCYSNACFSFVCFQLRFASCVHLYIFCKFASFAFRSRDLLSQINFRLQCPTYVTAYFFAHAPMLLVWCRLFLLLIACVTRKYVELNFLRHFTRDSLIFLVEPLVRKNRFDLKFKPWIFFFIGNAFAPTILLSEFGIKQWNNSSYW